MTTTDTPQGDTPLWTDEELAALYMPTEDEKGMLHYPSVLSMFRQVCGRYDLARAADRQEIAALKAENKKLSDATLDLIAEAEQLEAKLATLRAQADGGEWKPLADEEMRRISTLWGHVLMAIDLTLEHGPYAVCRRVAER